MKQFLNKYKLLIFSFLISGGVLAICSKSSPLYPMNDWVDVHCFLTLGKGILNGLAPYADLYEQKGPLLYMVYAVVSLFSQQGYLGQFLLEVITYGLFLYYVSKIAQLFLGESRFVYLIIPVLGGAIATTKAFCHGGSVEQDCLFIFAYGLYTVLRASREGRGLSKKEAIVNGIFAGALFWIKYTMVGFYVGLAVFVLIWYLVWVRDLRELLRTIVRFLIGFAIITGAVLVFCLITGCLAQMFECYFYNNLFLYTENDTQVSFTDHLLDQLLAAIERNSFLSLLTTCGFAYLLIDAKERPRDVLAVGLSFLGLSVMTFIGKGYLYYALSLSAYAMFGLIGIVRLLQRIPSIELMPQKIMESKAVACVAIVGFCLLCLLACRVNSENVYLMDYEKEDLPPYKFAEHINEVEDATLLNFGFLDAGFYHTADVLPNCRFFCTFNVNAPGMWETQYAYIEQGQVDFVITRRYELSKYNCDSSKYELIDTATMVCEGYPFTYYLYALKEPAA